MSRRTVPKRHEHTGDDGRRVRTTSITGERFPVETRRPDPLSEPWDGRPGRALDDLSYPHPDDTEN